MVQHTLQRAAEVSFAVVHVSQLSDAFKRLKEQPFEVVLLDLGLPDSTGLETFFKMHAEAPSVPVVILSGLADEQIAIKAVQAGAQDYLLKGRVAGGFLGRAIRYAIERNRSEQELHAAHARLRLLLTYSPAVIYALRLEEGKAIPYVVSEHIMELLGFSVEEALGVDWWADQLHPDDREHASAGLKDAMTQGTSCTEYRMRHKHGAYHWLSDNRRLIKDAHGRPTELLGVWTDISERKRAEETLRLQARVLESMVEGVAAFDHQRRIIITNPAFDRMFGYERSELIGRDATVLNDLPPLENERFVEEIFETVQERGSWSGEIHNRKKEGEPFLTCAQLSALDVTERERIVVVVAEDITERKQLEEHLRQTQKMDAIGQLAGGIAHDFNNILGCIIGYTDLMASKVPATDSMRDHLEEVIKASQRAKELVLQILTFSRQQVVERRRIRLQPVIKEALKFARASLPSTIDIQDHAVGDVPTVRADPTQIHQIIMNLATNAAHAMNGRGGELRIALTEVTVDADMARALPGVRVGQYARLSVSDTGRGMDAAVRQRIFEPFFTTKAPGEGTGLGLSVVHGIMDSHHGAITVSSEPGAGTTFTLYFPADAAATPEVTRRIGALVHGNGEHILFVDDDRSLASLGKKLLEYCGYHATTFTSALEALAAFRSEPGRYDVVITDLTMPDVTGTALASELIRIRPDVPVILATGFARLTTEEAAAAPGIRGLLMKPVTARSLADAVHRALEPRVLIHASNSAARG